MAPLPLPLPIPASMTTPHPSKPHDAPAARPDASSLHAAVASFSQQAHDCGGAGLRDAFALVARAERHQSSSSPAAAAVAVGPEVYTSLLQCCVAAGSLREGQQVHAALVKRGPYYCRNAYVGTKLAVFYARCGALDDAERAFAALPEKRRNAFAWAAVIGLRSRAGLHARALAGFVAMLEAGVPADNFVAPTVLKACAGLGLAGAGRAVHGYAWKAGVAAECVYVMSSLVDFYGKCGEVEDARAVFDAMPERTVVTWNTMLMAYIHNGRIDEAVELFYEMRVEGVLPTRVSIVSFLSASADLEAVDGGRQGHAVAVSSGLEMDVILGSSMINFYCKVGLVEAAEAVFEQMEERDAVTWNLMIAGYFQDGQIDKAFDTCRRMLETNLKFDCVTLASIIMACVKSCIMLVGIAAHGYAVRNGLDSDKTVASGLIDLYASTGRIEHARRMFNAISPTDLVIWKSMVSAYVDCGMNSEAQNLLNQMQLEGLSPSAACWDSVISAFIQNGQFEDALDIFSEMLRTKTRPNLRTWSLLISALSQNGMHQEVTNICCKMQEVESAPSPTIYSSAILAVKTAASIDYGKAIHACVVKKGLLLSKSVIQSLLNMYSSFDDRDTMDGILRLLPE